MRGRTKVAYRWMIVVTVGLVIGLTATPGALAQGGRGGGGGFGQRGMGGGRGMPGMGRGGFQRMLQPTFDTRELEILKDDLALDGDQQALLDAMYEGYRSAFSDAMEAGQQRMAEMRDEMGPDGDWQGMAERFGQMAEEWAADRKELEDSFIGDFQSILSEDQLNRWPRYQRDQRRRQTLNQGASVPGESVDVIELVEGLELDDQTNARIEPMLDQYATELDRALVARNEMSDQDANRMIGMMSRGFGTQQSADEQQEAEERMRKSQELHNAVRDTNQRYVDVVAGQLDPETAATLKDEFTRQSYPSVFRGTQADRYIERVQRLETLTTEQVELIDMLNQDYTTRVDDLNRRLVAAEKKMEKQRVEQRLERMKQMREMWQRVQDTGERPDPGAMRGMWGGGPDEDDPVRVLREEKRELSNATAEEVFRILTPDQQAEAPKPEADSGRQRWQQMQQGGQQRGGGRGQRDRGSDV